jgi:hypothetical protein
LNRSSHYFKSVSSDYDAESSTQIFAALVNAVDGFHWH